MGCLYHSHRQQRFVLPSQEAPLADQGISVHFAVPGGVLPRVVGERIEENG